MILNLMPGAWAGADYTVRRLTRETVRGPAFRQINPKAVVPALILDDGKALTESLATEMNQAFADLVERRTVVEAYKTRLDLDRGIQRTLRDELSAGISAGTHR